MTIAYIKILVTSQCHTFKKIQKKIIANSYKHNWKSETILLCRITVNTNVPIENIYKPKTSQMTYYYYKTSTMNTGQPQVSDEKIKEWKHLSDKKNWRITQLPNGYYQTEVNNPNDTEKWVDITRRETLDGAEAAIDGSVQHFSKKLEFLNGPKVVKTFK